MYVCWMTGLVATPCAYRIGWRHRQCAHSCELECTWELVAARWVLEQVWKQGACRSSSGTVCAGMLSAGGMGRAELLMRLGVWSFDCWCHVIWCFQHSWGQLVFFWQ
jgi:hypothetical protein